IEFVNIRDSFVWYQMPKTELEHKMIRERVNQIVLANGYAPMDDEELVTTGKPPVTSGRVLAKKCWSRSFVLDLQAQANAKTTGETSATQRQRLLTSLVCEDDSVWWAACRFPSSVSSKKPYSFGFSRNPVVRRLFGRRNVAAAWTGRTRPIDSSARSIS